MTIFPKTCINNKEKPKKLCKECGKNESAPGRKNCMKCIQDLQKQKEKEQKKKKTEHEAKRKELAKDKKRFSRTNLIKEADRLWSMAIRERDRGKPCITCEQKWKEQCKQDAEYHIRNKFPEWEESHQAGHFMSRRHLNTRWLLANGASQCPKCNCWGAGEQYEFALALEAKSPGLPESIRRLALSTEKTTDAEILSYIKGLYNDLSDMGLSSEQIKIKQYYL